MKTLALILMALVFAVPEAKAVPYPVPVLVTNESDDKYTKDLANAVKLRLRNNPKIHLAQSLKSSFIQVSIDILNMEVSYKGSVGLATSIAWTARLDTRQEIGIETPKLFLRHASAICFKKDLDACANAIVEGTLLHVNNFIEVENEMK